MLTSLFSELSAATESGELFSSAISTERRDFLAKGAHGEPVFYSMMLVRQCMHPVFSIGM